jgi:hypothetical protein
VVVLLFPLQSLNNGKKERLRDGRKLLRLTLVYCDSGLSAFFTLMSAVSDQGTAGGLAFLTV